MLIAGQAPAPTAPEAQANDRSFDAPGQTGRPLAAKGRTARRALNWAMNGASLALSLSRARLLPRDHCIHLLGDKLTVSRQPTDGQPGRKCIETRHFATRNADANLRAREDRMATGLDHSATRTTCLTNWGPTLEMSGGLKGAKQPLERPLDRRVRLGEG